MPAIKPTPTDLAAVAGAPILVVLGRRLGFLQYEVQVGEAITLPRRPGREETLRAAQQLASQIESFVRRHPTDWFHFG